MYCTNKMKNKKYHTVTTLNNRRNRDDSPNTYMYIHGTFTFQ